MEAALSSLATAVQALGRPLDSDRWVGGWVGGSGLSAPGVKVRPGRS